METRHYLALAYDEGEGIGVIFPDLPGCVAEADTLDEALHAASRVLAFHLDAAMRDGDAMPVPRTFRELKARAESEDWWDWDNAIVAAVAPQLKVEAAQ